MSSWKFGNSELTEEQELFKNKLSSRDSQIAAQETQLIKQAEELADIRSSLEDALHKLHRETTRVLELESNFTRCTNDLQREKLTSHNHTIALSAVQETLRAKELETRELEATLDTISHDSDGNASRVTQLLKDKKMLEERVKELQVQVQRASQASTPGPIRKSAIPVRGRSSSLSNARVMSLESDITSVRATLQQRELEMKSTDQKLAAVQSELLRVGNEKVAIERTLKRKIDELQASMDEKDDELVFLQSVQGDNQREAELLLRIEEDDAKIAALQSMLRDSSELDTIKKKLRRTEELLLAEKKKVDDAEFRNIELVNEKEQALDDLDDSRRNAAALAKLVDEREAYIKNLESTSTDSQFPTTPIVTVQSPDDEDSIHPGPSKPVQIIPNDGTVKDIERLLAAVDRLRGERDQLRADFQFLEAESEFTIEALQKQVELDGDNLNVLHAEVDNLRGYLQDADGKVSALTTDGRREEQRLETALLAVVVSLQNLDMANKHPVFSSSPSAPSDVLILLEEKLKTTEEHLATAVRDLSEATEQRNDLLSELVRKENEWALEHENLQIMYDETKDNLDHADARLVDLSSTLELVESERDSLALQVTNLTTDLDAARQELTEAETRYSTLQFHQLSNMSSSEATRVLKQQISDLEGRVMRRTEQIGLHQHDIKRMETNMRLQEERLIEMTLEMETIASQKDAMVEDCADAREARDEALANVEQVEEDLEALESKLAESDAALESLLQATFGIVGTARQVQTTLRRQLVTRGSQLTQLRDENDAKSQLEERSHLIGNSNDYLEDTGDDLRQSVVCIALSHAEYRTTRETLHASRCVVDDLSGQLVLVRSQLDSRCEEAKGLAAQLKTLRSSSSESENLLHITIEEYCAKLKVAQTTISEMQVEHQHCVKELESKTATLEASISSNDIESQLVELKMKHVEDVGTLQSRIVDMTRELEELQTRYADAESRYVEDSAESAREIEELKMRLDAATQLEAELQAKLTQSRTGYEGDIQDLSQRLAAAEDAAKLSESVRSELETSYRQAKEAEVKLQDGYSATIKELEVKVQELIVGLEESTQKVETSSQDIDQLSIELTVQRDAAQRQQAQYHDEIQALRQAKVDSENDILVVKADLANSLKELELYQCDIDALHADRTIMEENMTTLEAEHQRSISFTRHLERQISNGESKIAALATDVEQLRINLERAEKASNTAEINLSLQNVQHKREVTHLQRELEALRSKPNLEEALAEMEERNTEMEDLLRKKCAEIEENDDRSLEMLKENKKLHMKVETMTRKIQNLQTKLAAAKASMPPKSPNDNPMITLERERPLSTTPHVRQRSNTLSSAPSPVPAPAMPTPRASANRVASSSALPRPKTPERKASALFVFRRSPQKQISSAEEGVLPSSSKKRPPPEDYDSIAKSIPAQAFTPDCVRDEGTSDANTPRVRRVLSTIQSGFTPVRYQNARPIAPLPSQKVERATYQAVDLDDTLDRPRSMSHTTLESTEKQSKRGWLGKIRGGGLTPGGPMGRYPSSGRPLADRYAVD